ncbi:MAG TPA: T9SS type A sorting domain-containing protein [Ignavibacteria bacterium]|nr:T9SS type A sorting domain-containing protein [Ignavibacteria bacterium]
MEKREIQILISFFFIYLTFSCNDLSAQNNNYFPLSVGNKFVYTYQQTGTPPIVTHTLVTKDSIINTKKYFYCSGIFNLWLRVDSIDGNLYAFKNGDTCLHHINEILMDSLRIMKGIAHSCYYLSQNGTNGDSILFGIQNNIKTFNFYIMIPGGGILHKRIYSQKFGLFLDETNTSSYSERLNLKGCYIDGILYGDTSMPSIIIKLNSFVKNFSLSQNYPNPFNPQTKIRFAIPVNSKNALVNIKIYDIVGKEVAKIVNETLTDGEYEVTFNGSNLPSGIYFYSLNIDGQFIDSKKMMLIK